MAEFDGFLDTWVCRQTGLSTPDPGRLEKFQMAALKKTLAWAKAHSRFYSRHLGCVDINKFSSMDHLSLGPFTTPEDISVSGPKFACMSQAQVDRIFTLETSGTTGPAKRICFTSEELMMTRHYFSAILSGVLEPGRTCLIFFPGTRPLSAGELIARAAADAGGNPLVHGPVMDFKKAALVLQKESPGVIIGLPVQMLALGEYMAAQGLEIPKVPFFILTGDHVSPVLARRVEERFNARVLSQYGLTETGFGAAMQCPSGSGLHLRYPHLVIEIVDPETGRALPPGSWGEVVVTTLSRQAMPLIRYRTGDISRWLAGDCACGSPFPRLDRVKSRELSGLPLDSGCRLSMADLDDALFTLPGVVDFFARVHSDSDRVLLEMDIFVAGPSLTGQAVTLAVEKINGVKKAMDSGRLELGEFQIRPFPPENVNPGKRMIQLTQTQESKSLRTPKKRGKMHEIL